MQAPKRDTGWGPMQVHFEAARQAAEAAKAAGYPVELHEPNLPIYAEEGESKRLAKKGADEEREWRGDSYLLLQDKSRLGEFGRFLRDKLGYDLIVDVTAVDYDAEDESLWGIYALLSLAHKARLTIKVHIPKAAPEIDSVTPVWPGASWHERETGEMYGITYAGHPDPRNILLPDDWVGHPLRKDYEFPEEYHGISCV